MNITTYFLIPLVLFVILLYPLVRKAVALLEILVNKQVQQTVLRKSKRIRRLLHKRYLI